MTVLLDPSVLSDLEKCRTRLSKKATFESAIAEACLVLRRSPAQTALAPVQVKLMEVCTRCMTLLKTRYTSAAFWTAGKDLFAMCQVSLQTLTMCKLLNIYSLSTFLVAQGVVVAQADSRKLQAWHTECASILDEASPAIAEGEAAAAPSAAPGAGYLFEGQLSQVPCYSYLHNKTYTHQTSTPVRS